MYLELPSVGLGIMFSPVLPLGFEIKVSEPIVLFRCALDVKVGMYGFRIGGRDTRNLASALDGDIVVRERKDA